MGFIQYMQNYKIYVLSPIKWQKSTHDCENHTILASKAEASSSMARQIGERFMRLNAVMHPDASDSPHAGARQSRLPGALILCGFRIFGNITVR